MSAGTRRRSLRARIIGWSFVPTAIILAVVALLNFYSYQNVTESLVMERDRELARLSASQLMADLQQHVELLLALARSPELYAPDPQGQQAALSRAANRLVVFDGGVVILDSFGKVVGSQPERTDIAGKDWSGRVYFRQLLRSASPVYSDIIGDGPQRAQVVVVAVPIVGFRGELTGALLGMFRVESSATNALYGSIVKLRMGNSASAYVVDGKGRVIYDSEGEHIGGDVSGQPVVQAVLSGQLGSTRTHDLEGRDVVATYAPVPGTSWGLISQETWATLMSPSLGYRRFLLVLVALGVVVPALVVTAGVRRITRPIVELIDAAQQVASGNLNQMISVSTGDELEELGEQFNRMSVQLRESYAQLERRVADRTQALAALNAIAAVVSRSLDPEEILDDALRKTLELTNIEMGTAYRLAEDGHTLSLVTHRGMSDDFVEQMDKIPLEPRIAQEAAGEVEPRLVIRYLDDYPEGKVKEQIIKEGLQQVIRVPLVSKGRLLGTLNLGTRALRPLAEEDLSLLEAIGQQIGVAMENARLYERAEQSAAAAERSRLARELHDAVTQTLFSASLLAEVLPRLSERDPEEGKRRLEELRQLTRGALAEMRTLLLELRPSALIEASLGDLLRQLADAFTGRTRIAATVTVSGQSDLPADVQVALYRIAQETLNNVAKHSGASEVQLTLRSQPGHLEMRIADDGRGFDANVVSPDHLGLGIMRERAEGIGARMKVASEPGEGTEVIVVWPG